MERVRQAQYMQASASMQQAPKYQETSARQTPV